ncbi:MAG: hypothetical protein ACOX21_02700 [Bacillota bacterium]|nr:hypothetical protein [Bacillota bacterium]HOC07188.1 two-component system activity regulator YycH [Bacillota bacterium]HPZ22971.1 two-component system activity regulator YycH [Bacillota bacterium]HQD20548.1 two-component system activity regulator YycH [Bacillota bacterium]
MIKVKSALLVSLVICSIVLSALIIFGQHVPKGSDKAAKPWFGPKPGLHEISLPGRIYIYSSEGKAVLVETFSQMYSHLVLALGQMEYSSEKSGDVWVAGQYTADTLNSGVLFRFDYQISRGLLAKWLTLFYETDFPFAAIDSILVPLDGGPVKFINSRSGMLWQLQADLPLVVFQQAADESRNPTAFPLAALESTEVYTVAPGVFDLASTQSVPVPSCRLEEVSAEEIIRSFFISHSIIQEADGVKTYTDGFGALRIYASGMMEYSSGIRGNGPVFLDQLQLMQASIDFLSAHGGWPVKMLPIIFGSQLEDTVRLEFASFADGLPIAGENAGIAVEFQQGQVSSYQRHLVLESEMASEALEEARPLAQHLASDTQVGQYFAEGNKRIADLAPVFYWQQNRLIPAWRVVTEDEVIYVAAGDGRILHISAQLGGQ